MDALGRRPVIFLSLAVMAAAIVAFFAADGLAWLYLARIPQGLATGMMTPWLAPEELLPVDAGFAVK